VAGVTIRIVSRGPTQRWIPRPHPASVARFLFGAVSAVSERAGGLCAELAFRRPPRFPATRAEKALLARAVRSTVRGPLGEIAVWHWGEGPRVLLAHGWGSHAGRLTPFVPALLGSGFGVTAFDAPGHGASHGRFASLPEFVEALDLVARIASPIALVGHSLGAAAAALAMRAGVPCRAAVLLSTPADPAAYTRRYARWMRLSPTVTEILCRRLEMRYRSPLDGYRLDRPCPDVATLLVHDRGDARVPVSNARRLAEAWPEARLIETRGLGHHRILRDPGVRGLVDRFLSLAIFGRGDARSADPIRAPRRKSAVARFLKPAPVMAQSRASGGCQ
jgi:pimeloyl-ACP methyl ester carboxylesterase